VATAVLATKPKEAAIALRRQHSHGQVQRWPDSPRLRSGPTCGHPRRAHRKVRIASHGRARLGRDCEHVVWGRAPSLPFSPPACHPGPALPRLGRSRLQHSHPHCEPGPKQLCDFLGGDDLVMVDLMVVDNTVSPDASRVLPLAGGLLVRRRRLAPDPQVAVRPGLPSRPAASGVSSPDHRRSHRPTSQMDHRRNERANGPSSWRCPTASAGSQSRTCSTPIEAPGRNHRGQVVSSAPWRFLRLDALGSGRCGPAHTWSPLLATQHWRSSRAMSRTGPAQRPPANRPKAEARGLSGTFR